MFATNAAMMRRQISEALMNEAGVPSRVGSLDSVPVVKDELELLVMESSIVVGCSLLCARLS